MVDGNHVGAVVLNKAVYFMNEHGKVACGLRVAGRAKVFDNLEENRTAGVGDPDDLKLRVWQGRGDSGKVSVRSE